MARSRYQRSRRYGRKASKKCKVSKCIKKYVKRAIGTEVESKIHIGYAANQPIINGATPTALYALPNPPVGAAVNQRIGQVIKLKQSSIKMTFNLLPFNGTTNPFSAPQLVKCWLVSCKGVNTNSIGATSIATNFFEATGGTSVGPQNNVLDTILNINTDAWTCYSTRQFKLGASYASGTGPVGTNSYFDNSPMSKTITFNINKHVKMLKFDSTSVPNNRNLFVVMMSCNADGTSTGVQAVEYHYSAKWTFHDA